MVASFLGWSRGEESHNPTQPGLSASLTKRPHNAEVIVPPSVIHPQAPGVTQPPSQPTRTDTNQHHRTPPPKCKPGRLLFLPWVCVLCVVCVFFVLWCVLVGVCRGCVLDVLAVWGTENSWAQYVCCDACVFVGRRVGLCTDTGWSHHVVFFVRCLFVLCWLRVCTDNGWVETN